jgi:hypothetical protein
MSILEVAWGHLLNTFFLKAKFILWKILRIIGIQKAVVSVLSPPSGTLQFDCYFGRTSKRAMRKIGRYVAENIEEIKEVDGSFTTFMERGMTKEEIKIVEASELKL